MHLVRLVDQKEMAHLVVTVLGRRPPTSFSPGRTPVNTMGISSKGLYPDSSIKRLARSSTFTGSPMSRTKISPPWPMAAASSTSTEASGMVMK
jgi:hypothetical protein